MTGEECLLTTLISSVHSIGLTFPPTCLSPWSCWLPASVSCRTPPRHRGGPHSSPVSSPPSSAWGARVPARAPSLRQSSATPSCPEVEISSPGVLYASGLVRPRLSQLDCLLLGSIRPETARRSESCSPEIRNTIWRKVSSSSSTKLVEK